MKITLDWLREFTPYEGEVQVLADKLTMLGLEVDAVFDPFEGIADIVVGHVVECGRHPEADKLSVTRVDVGTEVLDIVCGAPNVAQGQKVAVAKVGTVLPDGLEIKSAKLRGQPSNGMICSERELGLSEDHKGILVLDDAMTPGAKLVDAWDMPRTVVEIDLTPNRADCLSVLGLAREVAMSFGLPLTIPEPEFTECGDKAEDVIRIEIGAPELCPLFQARAFRGVSATQSPAWLRNRLTAIGLRPINAVVDASNYVMFELGQPSHAFDAKLLEGGLLRCALSGQERKFVTLDNQERAILPGDLLIYDAAKPVGLAGVMGGANTETSDDSTDIILECAVFDAPTLRKTARRLGLSSDAGYRYERGVDQNRAPLAIERVTGLIQAHTGAEVLQGLVRQEPKPWVHRKVSFRPARAEMLLGVPAGSEFMDTTLRGLGCEVQSGGDTWTVTCPSHRHDLEREADLIEEVGRVYGMDNIPDTLPHIVRSLDNRWSGERKVEPTTFAFLSRLKAWGCGVGLNEAINYSFVGQEDLDNLGLPAEGRIPVANPLTEDQDVMRSAVAPGLLNNLRANLEQADMGLRLFEVARIFEHDAASDTTAREPLRMGILLSGRRFPAFPFNDDELADYTDLKGLVENLLASLGARDLAFTRLDGHPWLSPAVSVSAEGCDLGVLGRLKPTIAEDYKARHPVWMAELDMDAVRDLLEGRVPCFVNLPKFPPSKRDLTLVAPLDFPVAGIRDGLQGAGQDLLVRVEVIDEYRPATGDVRNLTFRLVYRSPDKTLKDKEVDKAHAAVTKHVVGALPVKLQE